jgi:phage terminase large subunit
MGKTLNLKMRYAPRVWQQYIHNDEHRFKVVLAHRSAGKTWLAMGELIKEAIQNPGDYAYIAPEKEQGKRNMWNNLKMCAEEIIKEMPDVKVNETEKYIHIAKNSRIYILAADENIRGMHMKGFVLDEVADINFDLWDEVLLPTLSAHRGWAIIIGTPKKGINLLNHLRDFGYDPDMENWKTFVVDIETSGVYEREFIDELKQTMHPAKFAQEYMLEEAASFGAIYAPMLDQIKAAGQIGLFPYDARMHVYTGWDLGFNDLTCIWFAQYDVQSNRIYLIDYYQNSNKDLDHYIQVVARKPYQYHMHFLPHDFDASNIYKEYSAASKFREAGLEYRVVPRAGNNKLKDAVMAAQGFVHRCFFNEPLTKDGLVGLYAYENRKDKKSGRYTDEFKHNDVADSFRYLLEGLSGVRHREVSYNQMKRRTLEITKPAKNPMDNVRKSLRRGPRP